MKIKIFPLAGVWHFGEDAGRGIDARPSPHSAGAPSMGEAMTSAVHLYAQRGIQIEAFTGHVDKAAAARLGVRYAQGHKAESPMRKFDDDLHLLFKLAGSPGRITWPEFRDRVHELLHHLTERLTHDEKP